MYIYVCICTCIYVFLRVLLTYASYVCLLSVLLTYASYVCFLRMLLTYASYITSYVCFFNAFRRQFTSSRVGVGRIMGHTHIYIYSKVFILRIFNLGCGRFSEMPEQRNLNYACLYLAGETPTQALRA